MEKADTLVLVPLDGMGHLIPMVELAKRLLHHGFSIHVLLTQLTFLNHNPIDAYISNIEASHPSISFHYLPTITLPSPTSNPAANIIEILQFSNQHILHYLRASYSSICALIIDMFCGLAIADVAVELKLPIYVFSPMNASTLSAFFYLPTLHSQSNTNFNGLGDANATLHFPGLSYPIPTSHIPFFLRDRTEASKILLALYDLMPGLAKGVIVNSFEALEAPVLRAFAAPGRKMAPVYCIGPITANGTTSEPRHESLAWLDGQPKESVMILSFGSLGTFSEAQLREIATGLEHSGQRFLWVVGGPPLSNGVKGDAMSWTEPDLKVLMPEGFEERTRGRGVLIRSWAPQVDLLELEAVAGFVTHCGWNSVLEAIMAGVAMIAWPLYGEQKINKLFLMEAGLAVDMRGDENGFVRAEEVEERVRWLMEAKGGRELRRKVTNAGKEAREAVRDGGTSHAAMAEMLRSFKRKYCVWSPHVALRADSNPWSTRVQYFFSRFSA